MSNNDIPLPDADKVKLALSKQDILRTAQDWLELEEAAKWAMHMLPPDTDFTSITTKNPISQVFFRAGLLACREYMARFVEQGGDKETANSIRNNWWPKLGKDPGPPRLLQFSEVYEEVEGHTQDEVNPGIDATTESLPIALFFLQS